MIKWNLKRKTRLKESSSLGNVLLLNWVMRLLYINKELKYLLKIHNCNLILLVIFPLLNRICRVIYFIMLKLDKQLHTLDELLSHLSPDEIWYLGDIRIVNYDACCSIGIDNFVLCQRDSSWSLEYQGCSDPTETGNPSNKYPELDGKALRGKCILEIPGSNAKMLNFDRYQEIAKQHDVTIRLRPE